MSSVSDPVRVDEPVAVRLIRAGAPVNSQAESQLVSKLPREVRDQIWQQAFQVYQDFSRPYALDRSNVRPGQAARLRIDLALLLTCRAIYLETYLMPFRENVVEIYAGDQYDVPTEQEPLRWAPSASPYYEPMARLRSWQYAHLTKVAIRFQQNLLENPSHLRKIGRMLGATERHESRFLAVKLNHHWRQLPVAWGDRLANISWPEGAPAQEISLVKSLCIGQKITHLTIRLGLSDWWSWTDAPAPDDSQRPDQRLRLEPMHPGTADVDDAGAMLQGYLSRTNGEEPDFGFCEHKKARCWGNALYEVFPDLERFELELETHKQKKQQLDTVVECAKLWTFPQDAGYEMRWDRDDTLAHSWKGAMNSHIRCPWMHLGATPNNESNHRPEHIAWAGERDPALFDGGIPYVVQRLVYRREKVQREPTS
ncbi:hypothetical protein PG989_015005 [Apiospora arundinis]